MIQHDLAVGVAEAANLKESAAADVVGAFFDTISRELSVGEAVEVEGFGRFFTYKTEGKVSLAEGKREEVITLPVIEPDFEPEDELCELIAKAEKNNPQLFADISDDDSEDDEEDDKPEAAKAAGEEEPAEARKEPEKEPEPARKAAEKPLGRASQIEFRDLSHVAVDKEVLSLVPQHIARQYNAVPIDLKEGVLTVAMIDPEDFDALQVLRKETGVAITPVLTTREDLSAVLDQYTGLQAEVEEVIEHADLGISKQELMAASQEDLQDQTNENAPTARIVYSLLKRAVKEHASDVHIEPYENKVMVRFRIDGILQGRVELPKEIQSAIISRLKILANLKIDEQRLPQDGRFNLIFDHHQVDFRLSTIPVVFGEKVVMRILDKAVGILTLDQVGLAGHGLEVLAKNMERSHGMILVTGPTGSGKTTTLYAVLGKLMADSVNILTLEDPVEYRIESINQSQVHSEIGYSFASGLRAAVRQDPDVIMLGEIRDQETADMAVHAALTGHVVLSTLHTNDAAGAFPRLLDMKIEPFLVTSSIHTVVAQRLTRMICQECKEETTIEKEALAEIEEEIGRMPQEAQDAIKEKKIRFFKGKGCEACGGKGYRGRAGVFEVLNVTEDIRSLILKRSSGEEITRQAIKEGMVTMIQDGIIKALEGKTSMEEVWRVTKE